MDKTILIPGASSGIGEATARALLAAGYIRDRGGAKLVLFLRKVLPDRAFDAMMLMGARPHKKVPV